MSRRFGRNQRRRMREQVTQLERGREMDQGLIRHQSDRLHEVQDEVDRAKRMVGQNSALFDPEALDLSGPSRSTMRARVPPPMDFASLMSEPMEMQFVRDIPLDVMLANIDRRQIDDAQHVRIKFGDGEWGYAISRQAIDRMPRRDLIKVVSREIAELIARKFKGDRA